MFPLVISNLLLGAINCALTIDELHENDRTPTGYESRLRICSRIYNESSEQGLRPELAMAVGWLESRYSYAQGRWLTTRGGRKVRAEGPMQILKVYHCKRNPRCDTLSTGVRLLARLVHEHGELHGLAIYGGGSVSPRSLRYARIAIRTSREIRSLLLEHNFSLPDFLDLSLD